ncbi:hypothetical protein [Brevibacterium atlanticum]|uniref:hypothetical protein n=1 Tax=Brevibacterium atlanticum TaxID=2697563 RepID=UPI0014216F64|nr:hypothetical protein [Brevibacterium atlanticum]
MSEDSDGDEGFGRVLVERSGGIGGFLLVWDLDIDASARRDEIGPRVAELPWTGHNSESAPSGEAAASGVTAAGSAEAGAAEDGSSRMSVGADRYAYLIESRYGHVRFGEGQMPEEWKRLVDTVRESTEPERRRPG